MRIMQIVSFILCKGIKSSHIFHWNLHSFSCTSRCWTPPLEEKQFEVKLNIIYFGFERYLCKRRARRIPRTNIWWRTQECSQTRMFNISSSWRHQCLSEDERFFLVVEVSFYLHSSQDIYGPLSQMSHFCQAVGTKHCPYTLYKQQRTYRRRNWHSREKQNMEKGWPPILQIFWTKKSFFCT